VSTRAGMPQKFHHWFRRVRRQALRVRDSQMRQVRWSLTGPKAVWNYIRPKIA
jgi:hypothetical protein